MLMLSHNHLLIIVFVYLFFTDIPNNIIIYYCVGISRYVNINVCVYSRDMVNMYKYLV